MSLAMTAPTRHPKSHVYRIRLTIPAHLRETTKRLYAVSRELTQTLGTKDPKEAKRLAPAVIEWLQGRLRVAEAEYAGQTIRLSDREISALCGQWLARQESLSRESIPEAVETYEARADFLADVLRGYEDEEADHMGQDAALFMADDVAALLTAKGLRADKDSQRRLVARLAFVQHQHASDMIARCRTGTWRQTITSAHFPAPTDRTPAGPGCTFDTLIEGWALDRGWTLDAKPIPRNLYDRMRTMERLAAFLGHREASILSKADAVRWKGGMMGRSLSAATVRNDMSEMSAIWKWGVANGHVQDNPFAGTMPPKPAKPKRDVRSFTDIEAATILKAARAETGYMRWVPWLLCATGARLNEVCQATKDDVFMQDGIQVIRIHDEGEGRSLKNRESKRTVPLHPQLVSEGFVSYVSNLPPGSPLWPDMRADKLFGQRSHTGGRRIARWLRQVVKITDARISPNHSWRHTFIELCRRVVMPLEVRSALTGHSARQDESAGYGASMGTMVQVMAENLAKVRLPVG